MYRIVEELKLQMLLKLADLFLAKRALEFPFLRVVWIHECPEMKTLVQQGISMSTPILKSMNNDDEVKVVYSVFYSFCHNFYNSVTIFQ